MQSFDAAPPRWPPHWEPLHSAAAERQWIDACTATGFAEPQLALVSYAEPAMIYGRRGGEEPERLARAASEGVTLLGRRTGGGAVLAGPWMLGFHVLVPPAHPVARLGMVAGMVWLGKTVSTALLLSRVANDMVERGDIDAFRRRAEEASLEWACYAALSHGELVDEAGRKLLGLSQARGRWGVLLSGGLLISQSPWETLEYIHVGCRPARSSLRQLASPGVAVVAPTVNLPDLYARLVSCVDIALDGEPGADLSPQPATIFAAASEETRGDGCAGTIAAARH